MLDILKLSLKAGLGLAVLATALLFFVYKEWLNLGIFSTLTPEKTFDAFIFSLAIAFIAFVLLLLVHVASKNSKGKSVNASNGSIAVESSGKDNEIHINK